MSGGTNSMVRRFRRRLAAIAIGSLSCAAIGLVVAALSSEPTPTRIVGGCLAVGALAVVAFWAVRLWSFPASRRTTQRWLICGYALGVSSLVVGLGASVWGVAVGANSLLHWLVALLVVIELGEHFGVRWVDGHGRWLSRRWLGGAAWVGLKR
jgi:putative flippase GtrA